jgi:putative tryptophan/tyrosine transport system substrate-binding protein
MEEATMTRRIIGLLVTLALGLLVPPLVSEAQQVEKLSRIGRLVTGSPPAGPNPSLEALQQGLRDLGYVEGHNIVIESRYAEGQEDRLPDLADEVIR